MVVFVLGKPTNSSKQLKDVVSRANLRKNDPKFLIATKDQSGSLAFQSFLPMRTAATSDFRLALNPFKLRDERFIGKVMNPT